MKLKELLYALDQEIRWCNKHKKDVEPRFAIGFIDGLTQAKFIAKKLNKALSTVCQEAGIKK